MPSKYHRGSSYRRAKAQEHKPVKKTTGPKPSKKDAYQQNKRAALKASLRDHEAWL